MEILKGQVRDPGYPDCECTYAKTDSGQLYYFIKDGELSNQNVIATTILKEAIGHAPYTSLGLINSNGDVLIPFENKSVTRLDDNLLLVERNVPITQSVVDAANAKADPFSATGLISTANAIKEQMRSVMGYSAEFVFDNQFSEAALYNVEGQNIGGAYFSFIGKDDFGNYYMSSNVLNSQIVKYDPSLVQNQVPSSQVPAEESLADNGQTQIDDVSQNNQVSDNPLNDGEVVNDIREESSNKNQQSTPDLAIPNIDIPIQNQVSNTQEEVAASSLANQGSVNVGNEDNNPDIAIPSGVDVEANMGNGDFDSGIELNNIENNISGDNSSSENEVPSDVENVTYGDNESDDDGVPDTENSANVADSTDGDSVSDDDGSSDTENSANVADSTDGNSVSDDDGSSDTEDSTNVADSTDSDSVSDDGASDTEDSVNIADSTDGDSVSDDENVSNSDESNMDVANEEVTNPVIFNATNTIRKLLDENRRQREIIDHQADELENVKSSNGILLADKNSKEQELRSLRKSMSHFRGQNSSLTRENTKLKSINDRQKKAIENLKHQNQVLKEQVAGISALGSAVAEANTIIGIDNNNDDSITYDTDLGYLDDSEGVEDK